MTHAETQRPATPVHTAVILAAGFGSRIRADGHPQPKPLVEVAGLPLIVRGIQSAHAAGVHHFVIVVGFSGEVVRAAIEGHPALPAGVTLSWVPNPDFALANGVSVLKARPHVAGEFFLMMADHLVEPAVFECLQALPPQAGLTLAVDRKIDTIFDMDDATKVATDAEGRIVKIGKKIETFDAIDTGVFRCAPALFEILAEVFTARGDTSLSDGVQALTARGTARVADIGGAFWQDVDDGATHAYAEQVLAARGGTLLR